MSTRGPGEAFDSPMLGATREPFEHEAAEIQKLVRDVPVAVFQALNRAFNERGLMLSIDKKGPVQ